MIDHPAALTWSGVTARRMDQHALTGATCADVRRALWEDRTLVKTFGPRGTVHLLRAADLPKRCDGPSCAAVHAQASQITHTSHVTAAADRVDVPLIRR